MSMSVCKDPIKKKLESTLFKEVENRGSFMELLVRQ